MKTVIEIRDAIASGDMTALDAVKASLAAIDERNDKVNAFIEVYRDEAIARAGEIDALLEKGEALPRLAGVPVAVKDNLLFDEHTASAGSNMLKEYKSTYTATVINRLIDAGAIIIGRVNMDEFAMGSSTETSAYGNTKNPWDLERIPGGSSGGSAACVAAGMVPAAIGSDTGGSIRQPAAMCGVTGFKPSYGMVSRYGLIAMASSLDQIGPFTQTAEDAALLTEVMQGHDPQDATTFDSTEAPVAELLSTDLTGKRIGVPKQFFIEGMDAEVRTTIETEMKKFEELGATLVEVDLPLLGDALAAYYIIMPAEVSSNMARFDGMRYGSRADADNLLDSYLKARGDGLGTEVKRRILLGTYVLSAGYHDAYYKQALRVRTALQEELKKVFDDVDLLVGPTAPAAAWKLGEKFNDPLAMYLADIFTVPANIAGNPAISVTAGLTKEGLPIGLQITGPVKGDSAVLSAAHAYQSVTNHHENMAEL
jgi:aspartyl-tRNA(Asn)/glutamyl-tRNA(Gln) amidotransferase subunit A